MQRMMDEMKTKPSGMVIYKPAGTTFNFAKCLAVEFLADFAIAGKRYPTNMRDIR